MNKIMTLAAAVVFLATINAVGAGQQHEAEGVVKGVKTEDQKITISHGPIKSMGMDGMTMDFKVYDPSMLEEVKTGEKIGFVFEEDKQGNFVIMEIETK